MSRREVTARRRLEETRSGVRQLVERQDRHVQELEARVAELEAERAGDGGSRFIVEDGTDERRLASSVKYLLWEREDGFQVRLSMGDDQQLQVMCTSWHGLAIRPRATNVVQLGPGRAK